MMNFPVTLKVKKDEDGSPYWVAEQKQLDIVATDYEFEECLDVMEAKIRKHFKDIISENKFERLSLNLVAARAEVEIDIKINRSLSDFMPPIAEDDPAEFEESIPEISGGNIFTLESGTDENVWKPQVGERVIYLAPQDESEKGIFSVMHPGLNSDLADDEVRIVGSNPPVEGPELIVSIHELAPGPRKPSAKFCKLQNCPNYIARECNGKMECSLTGYLPGNLSICPKDEQKLREYQDSMIQRMDQVVNLDREYNPEVA